MPAFDLVVVGSGGGPDETNLSAYLVKSYQADWADGILALEAGSGQGALARLLKQNPNLLDDNEQTSPRLRKASEIYSYIRGYLVTHAHLDHINSLVISAGSFTGPRRRIFAAKQTLKDLESVFSDRIWPKLASYDEDDEDYKLLYTPLRTDSKYKPVHPDISVRTLPLNHGRNEGGEYESAAFFIRHDPSGSEFLFFGDVEPDSVAAVPRTIDVWRAAAPKIPEKLSTIFIECSWSVGRPEELLFGHLSPEHLAHELTVLAMEVVKFRQGERTRPLRKRQRRHVLPTDELEGALLGLRVFVTHCKDNAHNCEDGPIHETIVGQVRTLVERRGLGVEIIGAVQGMRIEI